MRGKQNKIFWGLDKTLNNSCSKKKKIKEEGLLLMEDINQLMPGDRRPPQLNIKELEE